MQRRESAELLDTDAGRPAEIAAALADLRRINRWLGGRRTAAKLLARVAAERRLTEIDLLEVAAGSADNIECAARRLLSQGVTIHPTLLDRASSHLPPKNGLPSVCGDALALPFADRSFDVVSSSLFLHHLGPRPAVRFLQECLRVARHAVIVNDLERTRLHWLASYLGMAFYRSRLTRHDAVASVRQAYTPSELLALARDAGMGRTALTRHFFFRLGLIAWR